MNSTSGPSVTSPAKSLLQATRRFQFGFFEVDLLTGEIQRQGVKLKLQEKPFQLLVLLLERAGELATREELRRGLWPADTFVDFDANLKTTLNKLRRALGDSAENPIFIETVSRHGYRFLAPVVVTKDRAHPAMAKTMASVHGSMISPDGSWRRWIARFLVVAAMALTLYSIRPRLQPVTAPSQRRVVLLVVPFDNMSGDPTQEYFSDGLTDEMITLLGRQYPQGLAVIARTSAMRYKGTQKPLAQIARELGSVDYVLEGSVRRSGSRVGINAQLFRTQDQASLWTEAYDSQVDDLLAIQREVAGRIAHSLVLELIRSQPGGPSSAPDPKVYDAYLMGLYEANRRTEEGMRKSMEYFQQAIHENPAYAPASAALANSYLLSADWLILRPADAYPKAKVAALRALELDANLAEAHATLAEVEHEYEWKWADAEREFRRALELNPNSAIAHKCYAEFLMHGARNAEAIAEMERARDLDPLSLIVNSLVSFAYLNAQQYDRAVQEGEKVVQLDPQFAPGHYFLGGALLHQHRYDEAIGHFQLAKDLTNGASMMAAGLAHAYAAAGRREEAQRALLELQQRSRHFYVSSYGLAQVYAGLGDTSDALNMLDRAAEEHAFELVFLKVDRSFDILHEDTRFLALLKKIGFPV